MINSRSNHIATNGIISFFFIAVQYSIVYMCHIFFVHSSFNRHLDYFHVSGIVNSAKNTGLYVSFQIISFPGIFLFVSI